MHFDPKLVRNGYSLVGIMLASASALLFLIFFLSDLFGMHATPYVGILFFLIIPALFATLKFLLVFALIAFLVVAAVTFVGKLSR